MHHVRQWPGGVRLIARSFWLIAEVSPARTIAYLLLMLVVSGLAILQVWFARLVMNALVTGHTEHVLFLATGLVLTLIIPPALEPTQEMLSNWFEDRGVGAVDRRLMEAGARLVDLGRIETPHFRDELALLQMAAHYSPQIIQALRAALGGLITLSGLLLLLAMLHPLLPLALLSISLMHVLMEGRSADQAYTAMVDRSPAAREMAYSVGMTTELAAAKEVRVFGLERYFLQRFQTWRQAALTEMTRVRLTYLRASVLFGGIHAVVVAAGFWYVAAQAATGRLTLGDVTLYLSTIIQTEVLLGNLPLWFGQPYEAVLYTRALFRFVDTAGPTIAMPAQGSSRAAPQLLETGVRFAHVTFGYPGSPDPVLQDVTFELPAGKITALVGHNGAGKSTIVKLLTRMYDPSNGTILLDGVPLAAYGLEDLRTRIAVVYQDFARFSLTLRENITLGTTSAGHGNNDLARAARWSGADEVAAKLPRGYETELTRRFKGGIDISGGEWQKVALSRAFIRDAALVILDEPTAALDADAEYQLFARFRELIKDKTSLIISHRFSTIRMADYILVLEGGRIVEHGTHAELLRHASRYAELFAMQAERYR